MFIFLNKYFKTKNFLRTANWPLVYKMGLCLKNVNIYYSLTHDNETACRKETYFCDYKKENKLKFKMYYYSHSFYHSFTIKVNLNTFKLFK